MAYNFNGYLSGKRACRDEDMMRLALVAAEAAKSRGDTPRGAVLAFPTAQLSEAHTVFTEGDPLAHAEINVLRKGAQTLNRPLREAVLYCTVEPCAMCVLAAEAYGVREIVFGAYDLNNGFAHSPRCIHTEQFDFSYRGGVLGQECIEMLPKSLRENIVHYETSPDRNPRSN